MLDLTATLDGVLFTLPGGEARFSLGGGVLDEEYAGVNTTLTPTRGTLGRRTSYAFGEVFLPLVSVDETVPLVRRLELTLAGRYTSYSDTSDPRLNREFGDGMDPKVGLLWAPSDYIILRGTYGTSFRAPSLIQIDETSAGNELLNTVNIPFPSGPPATLIRVTNSAVPQLDPETAETFTLGFDIRPEAYPNFQFSGTYYSIDYQDRIAQAPTGGIAFAQMPELFPDVIYRPPSAAYIENILRTSTNRVNQPGLDLTDPHAAAQTLFAGSNVWINDLRFMNLAISEQDGFDISVSNRFDTRWGEIRVGANATAILSYRQKASANSVVVSVVDTVAQPVDLRGRAFAGLLHGGFDSTLSINYVDDYANPFATTGAHDVDSWITADLHLSYDFGERRSGLLGGAKLNLSVQNLFDQDPPLIKRDLTGQALLQPVGFDPANANPLGRFVVVGLAKRW